MNSAACSIAERNVQAPLVSAVAVTAVARMMARSKTSLKRPAKGRAFGVFQGQKMPAQKEMVLVMGFPATSSGGGRVVPP